ncbi:MAG: LysR family transcriptional regulator [Pseudomonadota bacterium]
MNLAGIQTFLAIVETGNLVRAAERLHVTQSTVTARLNSLEQALGQTLFLRRKSGAELTSAGFKFERYAQVMSDLWRQAKLETGLPPEIDAVCNIGCDPELWRGVGDTLFESLSSAESSMAVSVWQGSQDDLSRWLDSGLIDVALCYAPMVNENATVYALPDDALIQVATVARSLMRWDPLYIYVDHGEVFRREHAATYADGDTPTVTFGASQWAHQHLLRVGGSAYLPERFVSADIAAGRLFPVTGAKVFYRKCYLLVSNNVVPTPEFEHAIAKIAGQD